MNNMEEVAKIIGVEICKKFETRGACGEFVINNWEKKDHD